MQALMTVDRLIIILFFFCYAYQFVYIPVVLFSRKKTLSQPKKNRFAVLICARNEQAVIGDLIESLHHQTYDAGLIHLFVMADNCTDETAGIARSHGVTVYERFNNQQIGKGYAMETLMGHIRQDFPKGFDGYFVFDADNILSPDYIEKMNLTFSSGHDVVTDYRNSKNYGDNWLSAGSGLWYLRENRYLNHARDLLGLSCAVSGTGFLFSRRMAEELGTWPFHSLVEDVEFSIHEITQGRRIAYCPDAVLYDEQPTDFRQSWRQRCRWCKGELKVFGRYGRALIRNIFHGNFSSFDMIMWIMPAYFLTVAAIISNVTLGILGICAGENLLNVVRPIGQMILGMYLTAFMIGAVTTATEWRRIRTGAAKKILYTFTFPLFMFTYIPISIYVLFRKVEWKPIEHRVSRASLKTRDRQEELPFQ